MSYRTCTCLRAKEDSPGGFCPCLLNLLPHTGLRAFSEGLRGKSNRARRISQRRNAIQPFCLLFVAKAAFPGTPSKAY